MNGHLAIQPGDVIEVVGSTDCGLLEGYIRGTNKIGFFPSRYAQEVQFRQKTITNVSTASNNNNNNHHQPASNIINNNHQEIVSTNGSDFEQQQVEPMHQYNSSTAPRAKKKWVLVNLILPFLLHFFSFLFNRVFVGCFAACLWPSNSFLFSHFLHFFFFIRRLLLVSWCPSRVQWWVQNRLFLRHFFSLFFN